MLAYLHIPFCDSKCYYCAFNSYTSMHSLKKEYMRAIVLQLRSDLALLEVEKGSISSLFIGGGTPSTVSPSLYEDFFQTLEPYLQKNAEITSEANPNSASKSWLREMKKLGVNRISFGVQSFYDDKLQFLGRAHTKNEAIKAVENAHNLGFENISLDLMYGTMLDTEERIKKECQMALFLPINHISSYSLTVEENTPFEKSLHVSKDDEKLANLFVKTLKNANFPQYEVANFGKYQCKHNLGYWQHKPYLGIGAGAVGFDGEKRYYPLKDIKEYMKSPLKKSEETLSKEELLLEKIFLGLRSVVGVKMDLLSSREQEKAKILLQEKKLTCKENTLFANDLFLADELALFIC